MAEKIFQKSNPIGRPKFLSSRNTKSVFFEHSYQGLGSPAKDYSWQPLIQLQNILPIPRPQAILHGAVVGQAVWKRTFIYHNIASFNTTHHAPPTYSLGKRNPSSYPGQSIYNPWTWALSVETCSSVFYTSWLIPNGTTSRRADDYAPRSTCSWRLSP